ncbi:venom metalloproteinase antarease TserMP_A-like isoform X1 [Haemaphysalis longicornis]
MSVFSILIFLWSCALVLAAPQVVFPRLLEERSEDGEMFLRISDDLTLTLQKSSVAAPSLRVISFENGQEFTEFHNGVDIESSLYHDPKKLAAVSLTKQDSGIEVEGVVGPYMRIEPSPTRERSDDGLFAHVLHEIPRTALLDESIYAVTNVSRSDVVERTYNRNRRVPSAVQVEVFIVVDTYHSRKFPSTSKLLRYLCVMMVTANIRFAEARDPAVQLIITGMEKSQNEPYLTNKGGILSGQVMLMDLRAYAEKRKRTYGEPDIVFLVTGRDTYTIKDGKVERNLAGVAYLAGFCTNLFAGYAEDTPGVYNGIHTLTHEIGHLLGASHDGAGDETTDPNRPNSLSCSWELGHLMSYIDKNYLHHYFSGCSLAQIRYTVRLRTMACWMVKAKQVYNVTQDYPGMIINQQAYCQKLYPFEKNVTADLKTPALKSLCKVRCLFMRYTKETWGGRVSWAWRQYQVFRAALEYTTCDADKVCIQGRCVPKPTKGSITTPEGSNKTAQ